MAAPTVPPDPLVPANLDGWFGKVAGVVRRSILRLLLIQIVVFVISMVVVVLFIVCGFLLPWADPNARGFAIAGVVVLILLGLVVLGFVNAFGQAASFIIAILDAAGDPASLSYAFRLATRRAFPLMSWWIIAGISDFGPPPGGFRSRS